MTQNNRDDVHYQIDALNEQAWQQYQQQPETAWDICQQALTLSSSSPSPYLRGQLESLRTQSYLFVNQGNFTDALTVARQGIALYEAANPDSLTTETPWPMYACLPARAMRSACWGRSPRLQRLFTTGYNWPKRWGLYSSKV
ncbi:MAG: hypothetical protein IAE79_28680 [Anaerolinea sp.]|nr:hypothetical protein [Anaerolinea sp.]